MQSKKRLTRWRSPTQFVYFIGCQEFVKIGWATAMDTRLNVCQVNNPHPVQLLAFMRGGVEEEKVLHALFSPQHHRGEWFWNRGDIREMIDAIGDLGPIEARFVAAEWYLQKTGYGTLNLDYREAAAMREEEVLAANAR
jgi:hypothetical protein